jgi:PAP2 superfamily protein
MAVTGSRLTCLLLLLACSTEAFGADERLFAPPLAVDTVVPPPERLPEQVPDGDNSTSPDVWDRLRFDFGLALDDARNFYSWPNLGAFALGIAAAAPLANTSADRHIRNWYQQHVRNGRLDGLADFTTYAGQLWVLVPVALETSALLGNAEDDYWRDGGLYEWSNRSLRAIALGYPPAVALYGLLGSGRPDRNDSRWHPFRYFHGVSGHSFIGAVPFLTAASMTDNLLVQAPLVVGSFATGWARINNDRHYFSQVALGWWIAFLSVHSVGQTQEQRSHFSFAPCTTEGPGISLQFHY